MSSTGNPDSFEIGMAPAFLSQHQEDPILFLELYAVF